VILPDPLVQQDVVTPGQDVWAGRTTIALATDPRAQEGLP